jgi:hypothetical protein
MENVCETDVGNISEKRQKITNYDWILVKRNQRKGVDV